MKLNRLTSLLIFFFVIGICGLVTILNRHPEDNDIFTILQKSNVNQIINKPKILTHPSQIKHVFVIVEENHNWITVYKNDDAPYISKVLLAQGAYASNYHNVPEELGELHPSELNYILMEAGIISFSDHTFKTDDSPSVTNSTASTAHLVTLLEKKGLTWKSYQEGISGNDCPIHTVGDYAPKHNPMIFFQDVSGNPPSTSNQYCKEHVRPLSELQKDLETGNVPNYAFITPNLQHDMHNGTIKEADTWLSQIVPQITNSTTFKKDGSLFITWDEGAEQNDKKSDDNKPIGMIILSPFIKAGHTNNIAYSHVSLLKTVQEIFGLNPLLGFAKDPKTHDLFDLFNLAK